MTRGRFVVVEGGDGSGKSTQARRLAQWLRAQGIAVHETFEPGAGATGAVIRELLLHGPESIEPDRRGAAHGRRPRPARRLRDRARPWRAANGSCAIGTCRRRWCTRVSCAGSAIDLVEQLNAVATQGLEPDLVIVFDITDDVAAARQAGEPDRLEREGTEFHDAVRRAYRDLAPEHGWIVVDGDGPVDDVASRVHDALAPVLAG